MKNTLETRLGVFFFLAVLAAFVLLQMIGAADFLKGGYRLHGRFTNVQELKVGDPVKMAGVQVGRIEKVSFDDDKVKVTMKINNGVAIKTDSKATIKFAGLMGQNFISVNIGSSPKKFENDQSIETIEQPDLSALMAKLENVATGVENVTKTFSGDSIQNVLGPLTDFMKENNPKLGIILGNMQNISTDMSQGKGTVGKLLKDDALYNSAQSAVKTLEETAAEIKLTISDAKSIITNANDALVGAKSVVADINAGKGTLGKLTKDEALYKETTAAMVNLREILQKINQGQGSVGKLVNDDSFYKNVKMTLQKVDKAAEGLEDTGPLSVLGTAVNSLF
ncbi:MAG TPA: MlaD family protein [Roseimicrobium sp.]|nr:MlaD family protein [Roseimicrobium sp.]